MGMSKMKAKLTSNVIFNNLSGYNLSQHIVSSILPGFEYDIFISYRQKDNKFDGWVSRFVADLKNELDATFKENLGIYFDENPHDGLLEMHDVDKSLQTKIKTLIFIPILSQTYCDPKSFAWEHEFKAFNRMASKDDFGRDIKLHSGNVCSRIIPVVIRELDETDIKMVEDELGCRFRAIEFIYSAAGVNRPLTPSDNPEKNLKKIFYRDQINKVAYAVKEVIYGMHPDKEKRMSKTYQTYAQIQPDRDHAPEWKPAATGSKRRKWITNGTIAAAVLAVILLFVYPGWFRSGDMLSDRIGRIQTASLAILPVANLTGDTTLEWISMSVHDDIITPLSCTRDLVVRPKQSTMQYKDSEEPISAIAEELQVGYILEPVVKGSEGDLRLEIRLVEVKPEEHYIWTKTYNTSWNELAFLYPEIASQVFRELRIGLSEDQKSKVQQTEKSNPEIKKLCARGEYYMKKFTKEDFQKGLTLVQEAIDLDPADPLPYITLSNAYSITSHIADIDPDGHRLAKAYAQKALDLDSMNIYAADAYVSLGSNALYYDWEFSLAKKYLMRALELNPNHPAAHYHYGWYITLEGYQDSAMNEFYRSIEIDPLSLYFTHNISWYYVWTGEFEKAVEPARKTLEMNPDYPYAQAILGLAYVELGRYEEGLRLQREANETAKTFEHYLGISYELAGMHDSAMAVATRLETYPSNWFNFGLAELWAVLGDPDKAMQYIEKAYELKQDFVVWYQWDHYLRSLWDHPRFLEIMESINLPA